MPVVGVPGSRQDIAHHRIVAERLTQDPHDRLTIGGGELFDGEMHGGTGPGGTSRYHAGNTALDKSVETFILVGT